MKILCGDDEQGIHATVLELIRISPLFTGAEYKACLTLEDALGSVESFKPDVVWLDIHFPHSTRHDVMQAVPIFNERCAVVMLTGDPSDQNRLEFAKAGALGFIDKNDCESTLRGSAKRFFEESLNAIAIWKARHDGGRIYTLAGTACTSRKTHA